MVPPPKKHKPEDAKAAMERLQREQHEWLNLYYPRSDERMTLTDSQSNNHGFPWTASTKRSMNDYGQECITIKIVNHMSLMYDCWYCFAELSLIINHADASKGIGYVTTIRFSPNNEVYEFVNVLCKEEFLADAGWFPNNAPCHFLIRVRVTSINGDKFLKKVFNDWSVQATGSDVCLIVDKKDFYLGKHILARHSSFFDSLFYGGFKETVMDRIEIKELCKHKFEMFLNYIHRFGNLTIDMENVWDLAELAHRFHAHAVLLDIERFVTITSEFEPYERIVIGELHQMPALQEQGFTSITTVAQINDLTSSEYYAEMKQDTKDRAMDMLMKISQHQNQLLMNVQLNNYAGPPAMPQYPPAPYRGPPRQQQYLQPVHHNPFLQQAPQAPPNWAPPNFPPPPPNYPPQGMMQMMPMAQQMNQAPPPPQPQMNQMNQMPGPSGINIPPPAFPPRVVARPRRGRPAKLLMQAVAHAAAAAGQGSSSS